MTWLLDGNLLVALRLAGHEHHRRAHRWFASTAPECFATCPITQGTLLRVHMLHATDRSSHAAWRALAEICRHPRHVFWGDCFGFDRVSHRGIQGHRQVTDAWLAQLARERSGRLATLDAPLATLHHDVTTLLPM